MTNRPSHIARHIPISQQAHRDRFEAFRNFVRGYLHEDFVQVHGSVLAAAAAFAADATPDERRQLADELQALSTVATGQSLPDVRRFISRDLGSRWTPKSREELAELIQVIRAAT